MAAYGSNSPYSAVESSYTQISGGNNRGSGPIQYDKPINTLRPQQPNISINPMGSMSPEDRIKAMADKQYEKWAAQNQFQNRAMTEFSDARSKALEGLPGARYDNYSFAQGGKGSGYGQGSSGLTQTPFGQFMSGQGAAGLTGGSVSTPGQRYSQWNNQIVDQNQAYQQAMAPVWQQYGVKPVVNQITAPW